MGNLVLAGATSGSTTITPSATGTYTITLPAETGTIQTSGAGFTTNGVAYATSTSALTTSSALQFNGTSLTVNGTASNQSNFIVTAASSDLFRIQPQASGTGVYLQATDYAQTVYAKMGFYATSYAFNVGNVGIGSTSPQSPLDIYKNSSDTTSNTMLQLRNTRGFGNASTIHFTDTTTYNWSMGSASASQFAIWTGQYPGQAGTQLVTVDSSGNLLVGKTSSSNTSGTGVIVASDGLINSVNASSTSSFSTYQLYSTGASAFRFYVDAGGTVHATSTSISAISDASLKTNVRDLETGLTQVMALKPRRFDWINGDATNVAGFIAQEVEEVLPELVVDSMYSQDEEGNPIYKKNLKMGDILPTMVKSIQELSALVTAQSATITSLTERITALEGK